MENTIVIVTYFSGLMKVVEEDMTRNCSRENSHLILESMLFVTELLTTGTHYLQVALIVTLLTLSFKKHLSPELESEVAQSL